MAELLLKRDYVMVDVPCMCGFLFMVPKEFDNRKRQTGADFWCPSCGNKLHYKETENEALKRQVQFWENTCKAERARHEATAGNLTKLKKRVGNGVCPCCHRTFKQLAAHMKKKHPDYGRCTAK